MVDMATINLNLLQFVIKLFIAYLDYVMGCNHPLILHHDAFKLLNLINEMLLFFMCFYVLTCIAQNHAFLQDSLLQIFSLLGLFYKLFMDN
jgi:hypothetical protein